MQDYYFADCKSCLWFNNELPLTKDMQSLKRQYSWTSINKIEWLLLNLDAQQRSQDTLLSKGIDLFQTPEWNNYVKNEIMAKHTTAVFIIEFN